MPTEKFPTLVAAPPGAVTLMVPVDPEPSTAVMLVDELIVNLVALVPPELTAVAPEKFVPVMVTLVPLQPLVGVNEVMVGTCANATDTKKQSTAVIDATDFE